MAVAPRIWDLFCRVIDNHGDIGVCWRLASQLAAQGHRVRLWTDDASALRWMAPAGQPGVLVGDWDEARAVTPGDVVVEAFGCELDDAVKAAMAARAHPPVWINLEYLSAEDWVERSHGLRSPQGDGPAKGLAKYFYFPGFTTRTGGLLRETGLLARRDRFDSTAWLAGLGLHAQPGETRVSLFCYEPAALASWLALLARQPGAHLLVTSGRAAQAVRAAGIPRGLRTSFLPLLTQQDYDHLLWACDLNFVRGEDSLVRALWADRPFVWQIYPQADAAHHAKLEAFLRRTDAGEAWTGFHRVWNGLRDDALTWPDLAEWGVRARSAAVRLAQSGDLASQLTAFVSEKG